ncbi:hypothetical protein Mycch_5700 (plasmid) [Mycolicibacterium chubuense NBB4]|uniref:Uncharacterized protein n=1 Tax=Mycolicibacterium chubuense (strain NBB4) TaxID=710421 RepID=I4BSS7_MYCCN|nr:hypothetical protein [Mycolicibacterium chubuense]AFM20334.1 hypothetical protein Mycch_5700 [Mycolicibacterium chubuense NBB4]
MTKMTRRAALAVLGTGGGILGVAYVLRGAVGSPMTGPTSGYADTADSPMTGGPRDPGMMGSASRMDMSTYMDMFNRHNEIRRRVEDIPGGVRTTTESDSDDLVAQLQCHVAMMYAHLDQGAEVTCMSASLPTLFHRAPDYQRQITFTVKGVVAVETARDPDLTQAIRAHAREVTGFVTDGMPAMMKAMMGNP